ncbi:hypothetical protein BRC74_01255 [Halobacteriales archaeon QH_7_68_42]|nr:MAG: hypothetical protein BRC74_01255 [Halobacteriales archaeon QH_7_68_42]
MAHEAIDEAAVIGVPHERWGERPVAFVVPAEGADREPLPDAVEFIDAVPKTATGEFSKKDLREEFADESLVEGQAPDARE